MDAPSISTAVRCWLPLLLVTFIADLFIVQLTFGHDDTRMLAPAPKGTVKTVKAEDGDVIDCVDIYKQPTLDHPHMKNHKIQMKPSMYPTDWNQANDASSNLQQSWSKNNKCPNGSIPIRRPFKGAASLTNFRQKFPSKGLDRSHGLSDAINQIDRYAGVTLIHKPYDIMGITGAIGLYSPHVEPADVSFTRMGMGVIDGDIYYESAGVGWMVNPEYYGDYNPRFTVYFQNETYKYMCYNFDCPGFVQVAKEVALGSVIAPVSTYGGKQYEMRAELYCTMGLTSKIWLRVANLDIGYWTEETLPAASDGTGSAYWEGQVIEGDNSTHPTTTHMGSGEPPEEGYGKAALIHGIKYMKYKEGGHYDLLIPQQNETAYRITNITCYWTTTYNIAEDGGYFYYGGPGHSDKCW